MDQLSADQQETIKKASTERLRAMAAQIGAVDDEKIATMDRTALMGFVVQSRVDRKEAEEMAASRKKSERPDTARELEIQLEMKKVEMETKKMEMEVKKMEMEAKKVEMETKKMDVELEAKKMETKKIEVDMDIELKKI